MSELIAIRTGARLHFGPLSYLPSQGRHFGGVGVMIDEPGFDLRVRRGDRDDVHAEDQTADRVREFVKRYRQSCPDRVQPPPCEITIDKDVPTHNGLGSGTQLGLAVARGLAELAGESNVGANQLARRVGRGRRSAVGIHGFEQGGLIVDAGQLPSEEIGALACRLPMPDDWRVLLITPAQSAAGLSGSGEETAFSKLGSMPTALTERLCRVVVTELLPDVQCGCFAGFSRAVYEYGRLVGEFFAPVQGGTFGHPATDALVATLRESGICGAGQTSWGPTVFAFVPDVQTGQEISGSLGGSADVRLVRPLNRGALIERGTEM